MQQNSALNKFKDNIASLFQIKILINSSKNIKTLFNDFNLTPAEFLRPFSLISENKKIKIKSINSKDKMIQNFSLHFYDLEEFQTPSKAAIDDVIKEVIVKNSPEITLAKYVFSFKANKNSQRFFLE